MSDRQDDMESDDTSMSSHANTPYPGSTVQNISRMRSSPPPPSFATMQSHAGDGHRSKTVRLVVFGKPYSVPFRKIDTEKGILEYLNSIPSVQRKLKSSPGHGLKRLFANEVWEFRNDDGDTIRLEDWTDMVYGGGRLSLISNAIGEEHTHQSAPMAQPTPHPQATSMSQYTSMPPAPPMPQATPIPQVTPVAQPAQTTQTRSAMPDEEDDGGIATATKRAKYHVDIEDVLDVLDEEGLPRMDEDPLSNMTFVTPTGEGKASEGQQQQQVQQQQPGNHLIIIAYSSLKLPSVYPPPDPNVKVAKVSFGPRTTYGKALKALCGGNVPEGARLQRLILGMMKGTDPESGEKYLVAGNVIHAAEKDMLGDLGFTTHEGNNDYMVRIIV